MVKLKTNKDIAVMGEGGKILAAVLDKLSAAVRPGTTTEEIDMLARELLSSYGAKPSFLGYNGFPAALCVSVNEEVVHGVPSDRVLQQGDVVKLDLGAYYKGFHTDSARTVLIGGINDAKKQKLINVTSRALELGTEAAQPGNTLGDVGHAIERYVKSEGFDVVRDLVGHGIGKNVHEEPEVLNYGKAGEGMRLEPGMVIAIEPMVVEGTWKIADGPDGFSFITKDKKLAAHFEHTVAITERGPVILTQ